MQNLYEKYIPNAFKTLEQLLNVFFLKNLTKPNFSEKKSYFQTESHRAA